MAFVTEKEELKAGLILFRRGDVEQRMWWYCRMKMPKADRVLQGMAGWELPQPGDTRAKASKAQRHDKDKSGQRLRPR